MKKVFLNCILLLCALIVGSGSLWAADGDTHDFAQEFSQLLNNNASIEDIVIPEQTYAVKQVIISYRYNKTIENAVTMSVSVGSTSFGSQYSEGTDKSYSTRTFSHEAAIGAITISFANNTGEGTGHGTFYVNNVQLVEGPASGTTSTPTFSPKAGAVTIGTNVSISCATAGATIHYTIDGSNPTTSSPTYSSAITIDAAKTIKALAVKDGLTNSEIASAEYTIVQVATPTFSPDAGEVTKNAEITINCATDGATIYYTTDGSEPSTSSSVYNPSSKPTIDDDKTIKAIAVKPNHLNSEIASAEYTYARVKDYTLITSISNIISGKHYLIASGKADGSVNVLDVQNSNNRGVKGCTISSGTLQATGAREMIVYGPDKEGYYVFYDAVEKGYLYAAGSGSGKNYLRSQNQINDNSRFSISIDGSSSAATITAQGTNTNKYMRYNSTSTLFSCYASGQSPVYLFALDNEDTPSETISVSALGWSTFASPNALDFTGISTISAYQITGASGTTLTLSPITGKVPARTGLLISGTSAEVPATFGTISTDVSNNKLVGCIIDTKIQNANPHKTTIYVLVDNDGIAEFQNVASYVASTDVTIPANKAYLDLDGITLAPSALRIVDEENNATGIENIESGEKVVKFIKNGRILFKKNGIVYDALGRIVK